MKAMVLRLLYACARGDRWCRVEFAQDQLLDELPSPNTHLGLDRIEPIVEKWDCSLAIGLRRLGLHGSARHGVLFSPAFQHRMI
jgi:hypothetical protein